MLARMRRRTVNWAKSNADDVERCAFLDENNQEKPPAASIVCTKRLLCKLCYTCAVGVMGVIAAYAVATTGYIVAHSADPCVVAQNALQELELYKMPSDPTEGLPKIIHHQWKTEDIPPEFTTWYNKWFQLFPEPEYTHMLWTDTKARNLIKEHYGWFLKVYDGYDINIKRADAARYFYLHHYGGVHADLDYEPLVNFFDYLPTNRVGLVESPYKFHHEETQNSIMSSPKGDPFWNVVFDELPKTKEEPILKATGPFLLDSILAKEPRNVYILPCENFQRIPLGDNKKTQWDTVFHREFFGRVYPMKSCGDYSSPTCQFAKHHNTAVYSNRNYNHLQTNNNNK